MRVVEEEAEHFAGCVGPERVGVRTVQAAAGPGVTAAMNNPLLQHWAAGHVDFSLNSVTDGLLCWRFTTQHLALDAVGPSTPTRLRWARQSFAADAT
jgi:hypothetical protein